MMEYAIVAAVAVSVGFLLGVATEAFSRLKGRETPSMFQETALRAEFARGYDARKREVAAMAMAAKAKREGG